jgi:hypothetical protein
MGCCATLYEALCRLAVTNGPAEVVHGIVRTLLLAPVVLAHVTREPRKDRRL